MRRLSTRLAMGLATIGCALAAPIAARAADEERVLDRSALPDGSVLTVSVMSGTHLAVRTDAGKGLHLEAQPIADLFPGAEVVAAKAARRTKGDVVLGVVVRKGGEHAYHWVTTEGGKDGAWLASEPVFRDAGEPFRIVEVRNPEGDSIEITFRRGSSDPRAAVRALEEKVYFDSRPVDPMIGTPGRARLLSMSPAAGPEDLPAETVVVDEEVPPDAPVTEKPSPDAPAGPADLGPPPATIVVALSRDGALEATDALGVLRTTEATAEARRAALERALATAFAKPEWRAGERLSRVALEIRADAEVPWTTVEEVLVAAAGARVHRIRLRAAGGAEALDVPLPLDRGIPPGGAPPKTAGVTASISPYRSDAAAARGIVVTVDGQVVAVAGSSRGQSPTPEARAGLLLKARAAFVAARARGAAHVDLSVQAPDDVRFEDVLAVVGTARGAGFSDVRFSTARGGAPGR